MISRGPWGAMFERKNFDELLLRKSSSFCDIIRHNDLLNYKCVALAIFYLALANARRFGTLILTLGAESIPCFVDGVTWTISVLVGMKDVSINVLRSPFNPNIFNERG